MPERPGASRKTTIYLTPSEHQSLKIEAAQRGMTMSEIIIEALKGRLMFFERKGEKG